MRNVPGGIVTGEDFFERPGELARLRRELTNGGNLLLTAPRRVGKTSLILRLCEEERMAGKMAVYVNVEGCQDELAFAEKLIDELNGAGLKPELVTQVRLTFRKVRQLLPKLKVGAAGMNLEIGQPESAEQGTLSQALENVFRCIEQGGKSVVLAIDEMPELLLAISRDEHGPERVNHLLHWLRSLRQTYRNQLRWIFLGSIGLDNFVDDRNLRKTINDLVNLPLDALTDDEAHGFLEKLGSSNELPLAREHRDAILRLVGWPLPYHLQLVFHALVDSDPTAVTLDSITAAVEDLLRPHNVGHFDTWRQRLKEQFRPGDATMAGNILSHLCQYPKGRKNSQILDALMRTRPEADPATIAEQLAGLLLTLQRDGYLLEAGGRYTFRSFLLRQYWRRREIP